MASENVKKKYLNALDNYHYFLKSGGFYIPTLKVMSLNRVQ